MLDLGIDKLALIGAVALIVIGPEKLPRVARTVGHLMGKAQRYVADVKAEVNRSIELDELQKMKQDFESGAQEMQRSLKSEIDEANRMIHDGWPPAAADPSIAPAASLEPVYRHPGKHWRLKRAAVPRWYKQHAGVRQHVQSAAARVARHRPGARR